MSAAKKEPDDLLRQQSPVTGADDCPPLTLERGRTTDLSEPLLRAIFDNTGVSIAIDREERFVFGNRAFLELLGYEAEEIRGLTVAEATHPEDMKVEAPLSAEIASGKRSSYRLEKRYVRKNGDIVWVDLSRTVIRNSDGVAEFGFRVAQEITERKKAEERVREHAAVLAQISNAVVGTDLDFRIKTWNKGAEVMYGWSEREALGCAFGDLVPTEYQEGSSEEEAAEQLMRHASWESEVVQRRKDDHRIWVHSSVVLLKDLDGNPTGAAAVNRDISERKQAEAEYRAFFTENATPVFWIEMENPIPVELPVDKQVEGIFREGYIKDVSEVAVRTLGLGTAAKVAGTRLRSIYPAESLLPGGSVYELYEAFVRSRYQLMLFEAPEATSPGEERWFQNNASGVVEDGCLVRMWGSFVDITERKRADEALRESERLRAQARAEIVAEERTRLARDLHDAVTQSIYSACLIAESLPAVAEADPEEGRRSLLRLRRLVRGALAEMRALLFELRPDALAKAGLGMLISQQGDALAGRAQIIVDTDIEEGEDPPAPVKIALYRVAQEAFNNIEKHAEATKVCASLSLGKDAISLIVRDDGCGFRAAQVGKEKLGLLMMEERVRLIGGSLDISNKPGKGTTVAVVWPRDASPLVLG